MKQRIRISVWAAILVFSITFFSTGILIKAAGSKAVNTIAVTVDSKNITKKTYTLEAGKSKTLKVSASPRQAVKSISYQSKNTKIATVSKKGVITAKSQGTAVIQITVTGNDNARKSTWIKVKVSNPKVKSVSVRVDHETVTGKTYSLETGESKALKVSATPKNSLGTVTYKSDHTDIATVNTISRFFSGKWSL